jgi:hypothetical protein
MIVHLLKLNGWPGLDADHHWRAEIAAFQTELTDHFAPSMRQRIDLAKVYDRAKREIELLSYGGKSALPPPESCPVTLDQLLTAPVADLESAFPPPATE